MNNFKIKQEWIEAVMADSSLTPATARYAFGIYKHMFGKKDESFPGAKALAESTGLNDSQFYKYNQALKDAGYLDITSSEGRSNTYRLLLPTSSEGRYLPPQRVGVPPERVGGTSTEGTNTPRKTTKKTTMKDNNINAPVSASASTDTFSNDEIKELTRFPIFNGVTRQSNLPSLEVGTEDKPDGAIRRVDYENDFTHDGWLFYSKAAAQRERKNSKVGAGW
jgi:hypothetical protein